MNYGTLIEDTFPERDNIYPIFSEYFNNPTMTKIKNQENLSLYIVKSYCLTSRFCRYIICFVDADDTPMNGEKQLSDLRWVSLQTRTLEDRHNCSTHGYEPKLEGPLICKIFKTKVSKEASTYNCEEFPVTVTLLHTEKNTSESYQQTGTIIHALETWQTIITWNE